MREEARLIKSILILGSPFAFQLVWNTKATSVKILEYMRSIELSVWVLKTFNISWSIEVCIDVAIGSVSTNDLRLTIRLCKYLHSHSA